MNAPRISVIVPSYNQGRFLGQCLDSIVSQGYENLELIVMDGGSTDDSVSIIRQFEPHIAFWQSQPDGGQSAAINAGVAKATGDIVAWLNSDDLYTVDTLRIVADAVRSHSGYGLYIGNGLRLDDRTQIRTPFTPRHIAFSRQALKEGLDYILQPSVFFSRAAWNEVGGLDPALNFSMDWDILIRIGERYPVVTINEFLSMSREYEDTKTSSGGMRRAAEIIAMTSKHAGKPLTLGGMLYFLETLLQPGAREHLSQASLQQVWALFQNMRSNDLRHITDSADGFPVRADEGDATYLQIARAGADSPAVAPTESLPTISVVIPSFNQARFLERTLTSIVSQNYPGIEIIVMDGGSTDGSVDVLKKFDSHIAHWESEKDRGPAHAINKGFARAKGQVLAWLASDDMYASDTLATVGRAFADDSELSMLVGNALYVDEQDLPKIMDHGDYKTALYYGIVQPRERVPAYWSYVHSIPQPSTFFTRDLLNKAGGINEHYHFIFDFELFFRMVSLAKVRKVEKTLSFYRIHDAAKTSDWSKFLVELYRFSRPWWPRWRDPGFKSTLRSFTVAFMRRTWGGRPRDWRFKLVAATVALLAASRTVNVEKLALRWSARSKAAVSTHLPQVPLVDEVHETKVLASSSTPSLGLILFCSHFLPRYPGFSGGEIRDFHILQDLQKYAKLSFAATSPPPDKGAGDILSRALDSYYDPSRIGDQQHLRNKVAERKLVSPIFTLSRALNKFGFAAPARQFHFEASSQIKVADAYLANYVREFLRERQPRFLFVSPQSNGVALLLEDHIGDTRAIMASYDVEAIRLERLAAAAKGHRRLSGTLEARRAEIFERRNLQRFDGVIAVSELDRQIFVDRYNLDPARVVVVENGVDTEYFSFHRRSETEAPAVIFVASMGYEPNHLAAIRLIDRIMPLVWKRIPSAQAWLVGQYPRAELISRSDGKRVFVTGSVESVRGYLRNAQVMCAPLTAGSGTKYKVLEALSAGVPSVCTNLAIEGLDIKADQHVKVADDDAGLAQHIIELLKDRTEAERLAQNGRSLVEEQYAWNVALRDLKPWLETIADLPKANGSKLAGQLHPTHQPDEVHA
jgi:glycosyltransferase involved in cell wall biosynthesis